MPSVCSIVLIIIIIVGVKQQEKMFFATFSSKKKKKLFFSSSGRGRQFVVQLPEEERIAWIWCIVITFAVPELGTFFRSVRMCVFKSWKKPMSSHFLLVFCMETLHVVGLALLFFVILPELDVVRGAMLTNCVCFVPGLLGK